jgi:choline dehydrogenase
MLSAISSQHYEVDADLADRVEVNQARLTADLKPRYDFIVCGAGSSGSVIAARLAENRDVNVLLVEAGGDDDTADVAIPHRWVKNLGSMRSWGFATRPSAHVNYRSIAWPTGKVLGGGSSINVMGWARGHRNDWDLFADQAADSAWSYEMMLNTYRRIEDWRGAPDPIYRGEGGPLVVQPAPDPNPLAPATLDAARSVGIPTFPHPNGELMEVNEGAAIGDLTIRDGQRASVFRSYTFPLMDRTNLTVLTHAQVARVVFDGRKAVGVELIRRGNVQKVCATREVVLSLGAINTAKALMQSGLGDERELRGFGIPVVHHLPGVGQNLQDHVAFDCVWEYRKPESPRNNMAEAVVFGQTRCSRDQSDVFAWQMEVPNASPANISQFGLPDSGWVLRGTIAHPRSRGRVRLSGSDPTNRPVIEANTLAHPEDMDAAIACVQWCREIGNAEPLRPYVKREVMPGNLRGAELRNFIRNAAESYAHHCGTAKMGSDEMSVVTGGLEVHGVRNLCVADASIMPRITIGNTMAPCVAIGERAADLIGKRHGL